MNDDNLTVIYANGYLCCKDICRFFGISESTLRDWKNKGSVTSVDVNGLIKYNVKEVDIMFRSMNQKGKITRIFPDWFYWAYENETTGRKIDTWEKYLEEFPCVKEAFDEVNNHKFSDDKLENYDFDCIARADSPLSSHKVRFKPKENHPMKKNNIQLLPIEFEVTFEVIDAKPTRKCDTKNQYFTLDCIIIEPYYVRHCGYEYLG